MAKVGSNRDIVEEELRNIREGKGCIEHIHTARKVADYLGCSNASDKERVACLHKIIKTCFTDERADILLAAYGIGYEYENIPTVSGRRLKVYNKYFSMNDEGSLEELTRKKVDRIRKQENKYIVMLADILVNRSVSIATVENEKESKYTQGLNHISYTERQIAYPPSYTQENGNKAKKKKRLSKYFKLATKVIGLFTAAIGLFTTIIVLINTIDKRLPLQSEERIGGTTYNLNGLSREEIRIDDVREGSSDMFYPQPEANVGEISKPPDPPSPPPIPSVPSSGNDIWIVAGMRLLNEETTFKPNITLSKESNIVDVSYSIRNTSGKTLRIGAYTSLADGLNIVDGSTRVYTSIYDGLQIEYYNRQWTGLGRYTLFNNDANEPRGYVTVEYQIEVDTSLFNNGIKIFEILNSACGYDEEGNLMTDISETYMYLTVNFD